MPKRINIKMILRKNPHVNQKELDAFARLGKELHNNGFRPRGYQLQLPFEKQFNTTDEKKIDSRTVNLSAIRH